MAIIKPSRTFQGAHVKSDKFGFLKDSVRTCIVKKGSPAALEGIWLYFLPSYKVDQDGNGVWYKNITIRAEFGHSAKNKMQYYVPDESRDPIMHFERNIHRKFPEEAAIEIPNAFNGFGVPYGKYKKRTLFNVLEANAVDKGIQVLNLPFKNGSQALLSTINGRDIDGSHYPIICDPERTVPVKATMVDMSWSFAPSYERAVRLDEYYADADNLYNLDDVCEVVPEEILIEELKMMYDANIVNECMAGWPGFEPVKTGGKKASVKPPTASVAPPVEQASTAPPAGFPAAPLVRNLPKPPVVDDDDDDDIPFDADVHIGPPPVAPGTAVTAEEILRQIGQ